MLHTVKPKGLKTRRLFTSAWLAGRGLELGTSGLRVSALNRSEYTMTIAGHAFMTSLVFTLLCSYSCGNYYPFTAAVPGTATGYGY